MKKVVLLLALASCLLSCNKEKDLTVRYPKTELVNTTWKKFSFKGAVTKTDVYEFLHFANSTSIELYSADITGKTLVGDKKNLSC